jgi:hypothetical protein
LAKWVQQLVAGKRLGVRGLGAWIRIERTVAPNEGAHCLLDRGIYTAARTSENSGAQSASLGHARAKQREVKDVRTDLEPRIGTSPLRL